VSLHKIVNLHRILNGGNTALLVLGEGHVPLSKYIRITLDLQLESDINLMYLLC